MMVPFDWMDTGATDEAGIGDLEFRTGIVGRISPTLRYGFGLNTVFDTAREPEFGDSALVLRPITAISWSKKAVARSKSLVPSVTYPIIVASSVG